MHLLLVAQLLVLLALANGSPVAAKKILSTYLDYPLDGRACFLDGRPLLGASKTVRGVVFAIVTASVAAPLIGLSVVVGVVAGAAAMLGDLLSSFVKRRLGLPPSSMALGLDQVPESMLPAFASRWFEPLSLLDVALVVGLFFVGELVLSRILYIWKIRDRPY